MKLSKAKSLDKVLLEFTGNKTIDWRMVSDFKTREEYNLWEENVNVLIGDGFLKKDYQSYKLCLSEKGFGVMTDLKSFGYTKKAKSILFDKIKNIILLTLSVLTFLILLFKFSNDILSNKSRANSEASENKNTIQKSEELIKIEKYHEDSDSLILKSDTSKSIQTKLKHK